MDFSSWYPRPKPEGAIEELAESLAKEEPVDPKSARREARHDRAWAVTHRLNRFTKKFLGPAQLGEPVGPTHVPDTLPVTPCSVCGQPLNDHELVRTTDAKMRLYCPKPTTAD